MNSIVSN
ncbi:hypothetical protein S40288_11776 [Stachybotrys chartarum IBT 40288]|nr:hypothetical protein S40288_11776 [Stachybotrys chartarum IBT 40288]